MAEATRRSRAAENFHENSTHRFFSDFDFTDERAPSRFKAFVELNSPLQPPRSTHIRCVSAKFSSVTLTQS